MTKLPDTRIYYAQNREDLILEALFPDIKTGFYVDVGACHPHVASVTKRFYLNGWRGINIEPQAELCELFNIERPRDINLNVGISDKKSKMTMRAYIYNRGLTTFANDMKRDYEGGHGDKTEEYEDVSVEVYTLKEILKTQKVASIQFLKVDVEGFEYEVLNGNDWQRFRPEVICIEANHVIQDWHPLLADNGYKKVFFDGLNEYYVDTKTDRAEKFDYVDHVVTRLKGGVASDDYDRIVDAQNTAREHQQTIAMLEENLVSAKGLLKRLAVLVPKKTVQKLGLKKAK